MKREADGSIIGEAGFTEAMDDFDVDVLIERSRQSIAGRWKDAPASAGGRGVTYDRFISRITEPENGKRLQRAIQMNCPGDRASAGRDGHIE